MGKGFKKKGNSKKKSKKQKENLKKGICPVCRGSKLGPRNRGVCMKCRGTGKINGGKSHS